MILLSVEGAQISYSEHGAGDCLALVHAGVFSDWFLPLSKSPTLQPYRLIFVRRAGYAGSPPSRHLTIKDHAGHLAKLAEHLQVDAVHWVGHSSGCQVVLQLALEHPELVRTLTLLEPAAGGGFTVPAAEELGRQFVGPAMAAFKGGDLNTAFDLFMRGVGGNEYRAVIEQRLGTGSIEQAISQSAFFFQDEVPAVLESSFGPTEAARVRCPILVAEGADSAAAGLLSRQITERAIQLFPHAEVVRITATNHLMPLQNPEAVARVIRDFVSRQPGVR